MVGVSKLPAPVEAGVRVGMGPQGHAAAIGTQVIGLSLNVAGDAIEIDNAASGVRGACDDCRVQELISRILEPYFLTI